MDIAEKKHGETINKMECKFFKEKVAAILQGAPKMLLF